MLAGVAGDVAADDAGIDYLEQRAHVLFWGLNRHAETEALLASARAWSPEPGWQRRLEPLRVNYAALIEGFAGSIDALKNLVADPDADPETRRMAERRLALSLFFTGRMRESYALARDVRPSIPLDGYSDALALGVWRLLGFESGDHLTELDTTMTQTLREAVRANDHEAAGQAAFSRGYVRFLEGRHRDAARWYEEAELHFERQDTFGTLIHVQAMRVGVDASTGDLPGMEASLERLYATLAGREPVRPSGVRGAGRGVGGARAERPGRRRAAPARCRCARAHARLRRPAAV